MAVDGEEGGAAELAQDGLPPLRSVIAAAGLSARKSLGQNFLLDLNLTRRIARSAAPLGAVLEIGPGPGGLTRALLIEGAEVVVAVERDHRCLAPLAEIAAHWPDRLRVIEDDALSVSDQQLGLPDAGAQIVANLPYNIGTELVVRWLRAGQSCGAPSPWWRQATVMLQREVAERLVARTGAPAYGRLAVLAQWRGAAEILFDISPRAFTPPPKVTSSVVRIRPAPVPNFDCPLEALERVTQAAFGQRRKMLRRSLKSLEGAAGLSADALLESADIDPTRRAETVSPAEFARLAKTWWEARAR